MDMTAVKQPSVQTPANNYVANPEVAKPADLALNKPTAANKSESGKNQSQSQFGDKGKEELTREDASKLAEHLNKFMVTVNADLRFEMHDGTQRLMVKFIDIKNNQVIKEFPPHELLDTLAAIRDYVGVLLDKRV
ncbi:flagellar protein FlaG protein [Desulfitobacterium hafniense DCB-2]|uniref:Flagellar protein FlaG protein n=1 Tax=Desulfitobacterium hafniense (strain DSM 10664 / DCB-2) TaxID=272564 RepID=B8FTV5_DESHD|nr:flagellar protein FlaG [Desulfitobacterium hafniense]ACL22197.1 flagellar protein FlaG protein [Desulfitobacterium hafniense DCB-2]